MTTRQITASNDGCQVAVSKLCSRLNPPKLISWVVWKLAGPGFGAMDRVGSRCGGGEHQWWEDAVKLKELVLIWAFCPVKLRTHSNQQGKKLSKNSREAWWGQEEWFPDKGSVAPSAKHCTVTESHSGNRVGERNTLKTSPIPPSNEEAAPWWQC